MIHDLSNMFLLFSRNVFLIVNLHFRLAVCECCAWCVMELALVFLLLKSIGFGLKRLPSFVAAFVFTTVLCSTECTNGSL